MDIYAFFPSPRTSNYLFLLFKTDLKLKKVCKSWKSRKSRHLAPSCLPPAPRSYKFHFTEGQELARITIRESERLCEGRTRPCLVNTKEIAAKNDRWHSWSRPHWMGGDEPSPLPRFMFDNSTRSSSRWVPFSSFGSIYPWKVGALFGWDVFCILHDNHK